MSTIYQGLPPSIFPDPEHEQDLLYTVITAPYSKFSNTASCVQASLVKRQTKTTKTIAQLTTTSCPLFV